MSTLSTCLKYVAAGFIMAIVLTSKVFGADVPAEVEGVITADTTWSGEVIVYGDVLVPEGVTLTIAPGTMVLFAYSESSKIEPMFLSMGTELLVRGRLVAEGDTERPIRFGPAPESVDLKKPARGDWGGLIFDGHAASESIVSDAEISMAETAVSVYYASPVFTRVRARDCEYGFVCMGGGSPVFEACEVTGAETGVIAAKGAGPRLKDCILTGNVQDYNILKESR